MQKENKPLNRIQNNTGASMVFVLAVMFLLLTLGVSALVAASANASAVTNKQSSDQLNLYIDSIQKSIMYSLQTSGKDAVDAEGGGDSGKINNATTLGGQILREVYKQAWLVYPEPIRDFTLHITPALSGGTGVDVPDLSAITSVTITLSSPGHPSSAAIPLVRLYPESEHPILLENGEMDVIRQPQTAAIKGTATVTVTATHREKSITSVVTYDFTGGFLEDHGNPSTMFIANAGNWRFVSHEKVNR